MKVVHQRRRSTYTIAQLKDVQIKFKKEEFASGTGQNASNAVVKDAQIK